MNEENDSQSRVASDDRSQQTDNSVPEQTTDTVVAATSGEETSEKNRFRRLLDWYWRKKWLTLPLTLLAILGLLAAIPWTRYAIAGLFVEQTVTVRVVDSTTQKAVTQADVQLDGATVRTDKNGEARLASHVGDRDVTVTKKYYKDADQSVLVPLFSETTVTVALEATGRLVPITVTDRITGAKLADVVIDAGNDNQVRTDTAGTATLVVPTQTDVVSTTLSLNGYLSAQADVHQSQSNEFQLTPTGSMYFLSKQSGKIDVVKTNLDGSDRQTVLAGTGSEEDNDTSLLASRDWHYLALKAKRAADKPAGVYIVDTSTGKLTTVQADGATIDLVGWSDHTFLYKSANNTLQYWEAKRDSLKSYNADNGQQFTIDQNASTGDSQYNAAYELIGNYYIQNNQVVYTKTWTLSGYNSGQTLAGKQQLIMSSGLDGAGKKTLQSYDATKIGSIATQLYRPHEIYFQLYDGGQTTSFVELENGKITPLSGDNGAFGRAYPTYLLSPSGTATFWAEVRDGKNALFTGDSEAAHPQQLAAASDFTPYGWLTDKYILMQKNGSELYITTPEQLKAGASPLKISDYHRPNLYYPGYGSGYGGL